MAHSNWYLVAYDISHPRRLQRVHRLLKKRALPVQKSVFFFQGHEGQLKQLLDEVATLMKKKEDDLRAWPVDRMGEAWMYGRGIEDSVAVHPPKRHVFLRWLKRLVA